MNKLTKTAIALALLASPWAWMPQVLAARTADLSISAVVTGNCRIRVVEPSGIYIVDCSDNVQRPQTLRTPIDSTSPAAAGNTPALPRESLNGGSNGNATRQETVTTLVY